MDVAADSGSSDRSCNHNDHDARPPAKRKRSSVSIAVDGSERERHCCPECDRTFGRIEHMKRHAASHSSDRPFKCSLCDKGFYRLDTMQRHELIHREDNDNSKSKGARACTECAAAKVRCSGGAPCTRCSTKATECRYPDTRLKQDEPTSPEPIVPHTREPISQEVSASSMARPPPPPQKANTVSNMPFSPTAWGDSAASPAQWFPSNGSVDFSVRSDFQEPSPMHHRHSSFTGSQAPPPALTSYSDTYNNLKSSGTYVAPPANNAPTPGSVNTTGTRHWLETLLEPQPLDSRDVGTPGTHTSQRTASISETYLDGDGARLPKIGIHRRFNSRPSLQLPVPGYKATQRVEATTYSFPSQFCHPDPENVSRDRRIINDYIYDEIRRSFERICGPNSSFAPVYESPQFPSFDIMQSFICSYLDEFQPIVPMLHLPTLDLRSSHWLLALGLASMGCHFSDSPEAEPCALALNEFLRRAILDVQEMGEHAIDEVSLAQVKLLNCTAMTYCADERMEKLGWRQHTDVVQYCRTLWITESTEDFSAPLQAGDTVELQWRRWRDVEARRRTGYGIWVSRDLEFNMSISLTGTRCSTICGAMSFKNVICCFWKTANHPCHVKKSSGKQILRYSGITSAPTLSQCHP